MSNKTWYYRVAQRMIGRTKVEAEKILKERIPLNASGAAAIAAIFTECISGRVHGDPERIALAIMSELDWERPGREDIKKEQEKRCEFYPVPEDDSHGGVCYAGSELGRMVCTKSYSEGCQWVANARKRT